MDKELLLKDLESNLNIKIADLKTLKEDNGLVLLVNDKYILKALNDKEYDIVNQFELYYKFVKGFRKAIYKSDEYKYLVYDYIEADRFVDYNKMRIFNQIYDLVREERKIESSSYGYLDNPKPTWYDFLKEEVDYSKALLDSSINIDTKIVDKALKTAKKEKIEPYLIHGDLGVHNFIVRDKLINVIDPMGVIGDYLYDFYFALLSDYSITDDLDLEFVLSYFDRKEKYKKALFVIVYYIRMCRAYKYNKADYERFLKDYKYLSLK